MGTEGQTKFKEHVRYRVCFIQSGKYTELFGTKAVVVVYLVVGQNAVYRRQTMCKWAEELLRELDMEGWGESFKFGAIQEDEIGTMKLFTNTIWQVPFQKPLVSLFD